MPQRVIIDYDQIHQTARKGIYRAAVFLGLGVNAADSDALSEYHLVRDTNIRLLPDTIGDATLKNWKTGFRLWVVGCGFRELVDRLCVFLDQIHHASAIAARCLDKKAQHEFDHWGLDKKIAKLEARFGVSCDFGMQLATLYPIRNCFVHRLGLVGVDDTKNGDPLTIRYMRYQTMLAPSSKEPVVIPDLFDPNSPTFFVPAEGLGLKWCEEAVEFSRGNRVRFTPKQLTEILFFADCCATGYIQSAVRFAVSQGAQVNPAPESESRS